MLGWEMLQENGLLKQGLDRAIENDLRRRSVQGYYSRIGLTKDQVLEDPFLLIHVTTRGSEDGDGGTSETARFITRHWVSRRPGNEIDMMEIFAPVLDHPFFDRFLPNGHTPVDTWSVSDDGMVLL
jgi:hypothetical protein